MKRNDRHALKEGRLEGHKPLVGVLAADCNSRGRIDSQSSQSVRNVLNSIKIVTISRKIIIFIGIGANAEEGEVLVEAEAVIEGLVVEGRLGVHPRPRFLRRRKYDVPLIGIDQLL